VTLAIEDVLRTVREASASALERAPHGSTHHHRAGDHNVTPHHHHHHRHDQADVSLTPTTTTATTATTASTGYSSTSTPFSALSSSGVSSSLYFDTDLESAADAPAGGYTSPDALIGALRGELRAVHARELELRACVDRLTDAETTLSTQLRDRITRLRARFAREVARFDRGVTKGIRGGKASTSAAERLAEVVEECAARDRDVERLRAKLRAAGTGARRGHGQSTAAHSTAAHHPGTSGDLQARIAIAEARAAASDRHMASDREQLATLTESHNDVTERLAAATERVHAREAECASLRSRLEECAKRLSDSDARALALAEEGEGVRRRLTQATDRSASLERARDAARREMRTAREQRDALTDERDRLAEEIKTAGRERDSAVAQLVCGPN
jgi:predicted  nucleic acid-binding Zn-ribbon protein